MKTFVIAVVLSYFKMKAIGQTLATMRNISLVVHLPLLGVVISAIGHLIFTTFFELATYDTMEATEINENVFKFSEGVCPVPS